MSAVSRVRDWFANPWGQPRLLGAFTWAYMVWSIVPVGIAILFSFNNGTFAQRLAGVLHPLVVG